MTSFHRAVEEVRRASEELPSEDRVRQRARLVEAVAAQQRPKARFRRMAPLVCLAATVACVIVWSALSGRWGAPAQTAALPPTEQWWTRVSADTPHRIGERGELTLVKESTGHVAHEGSSVSVVLDRGEVVSRVVPNRGTKWAVRAGAYLAEAVGTQFSVVYDPAADDFRVSVVEGTVRVSGGQLGGSSVTLQGGQSLSIHGSHLSIDRGTSSAVEAPSAEPPPADALPAGAAPPQTNSAPVTQAQAAGSSSVDSGNAAPAAAASTEPVQEPSWAELHAQGKYAEALAAADKQGFDGLLQSLPCGELSQLADAARLARSGARAERALRGLRGRCANTAAGARAAFLLGRLADDARPAEAAAWYSKYLEEGGAGGFTEQALGRLISAEQRSGHADRARAAAERYLKSFPSGSYADLARSVVSNE